MEKDKQLGFADLAASIRKIKQEFFAQINIIIDWRPIDKKIRKYYQKGQSATGSPSWEGLVLFKMCLLQTWYGLSDYEVEEQVNDRISFSQFIGISLDQNSPDHSVLSRFRTALTKAKALDKLLMSVNQQLTTRGAIVETGTIIDASVTDTLRKPKGKKEYQAVEDRQQSDTTLEQAPEVKLIEKIKDGVDTEARWIKKAGKLRYGYKQHTATDEHGLILGVVTTSANESDIKHLRDVLEQVNPKSGTWVKADKGYKSKENDEVLQEMKLKNHILKKAVKGKELTNNELKFNKLISKTRYKIERTFGSIRKWFKTGTARYVGIDKMHTQHLMEAIAYNLYRAPGIIMSNCEKQPKKLIGITQF